MGFYLIIVYLINIITKSDSFNYHINDIGLLGKKFDGIGAISGGGATSKLLINYQEPYRSEILDYLFKPNYGASLQILKVEIGGDSQSTDGSESSHMHEHNDLNFNRGYEWWLMKEAKKRNNNIKLYGLPWTFPGWLGHNTSNPFTSLEDAVEYTLNWILGARYYHNLTIDYIGVWNERNWDPDYVKLLRKMLNKFGLVEVGIVIPDAMNWNIVDDLQNDPELLNSIVAIGQHYPGASSPADAKNLGIKLWASEDFSTFNDLSGGGCWARVLNEGPVTGNLTSFIAWNLITSYYYGLPYSSSSLMTANEPWSGHYVVNSPIWVTAHHTQFYDVDWSYLENGVGILKGNGTYISVTNDARNQLTIVVEMIDPVTSPCFYSMPKFDVANEDMVTFVLGGSFVGIKYLHVRYSYLDFTATNNSIFFQQLTDIEVVDRKFSFLLKKNEIYTLTTVSSEGSKELFKHSPPPSSSFPLPYFDDFESYEIGSEPFNFAQQSGSYEVTLSRDLGRKQVMTQVVTRPPIDTCYILMTDPPNIIGSYLWYNTKVQTDVYIPTEDTLGVYLASQTSDGGCDTNQARGFHLRLDLVERTASLTDYHNGTGVFIATNLDEKFNGYKNWFTISLEVKDKHLVARLNGKIILDFVAPYIPSGHGFVVFGPLNFSTISFDNFLISRADVYRGGVELKKYKKFKK